MDHGHHQVDPWITSPRPPHQKGVVERTRGSNLTTRGDINHHQVSPWRQQSTQT